MCGGVTGAGKCDRLDGNGGGNGDGDGVCSGKDYGGGGRSGGSGDCVVVFLVVVMVW